MGVQIPTHKEAILRAKMGVPRHVQWSIYSKELGRGLHQYGADANLWCSG